MRRAATARVESSGPAVVLPSDNADDIQPARGGRRLPGRRASRRRLLPRRLSPETRGQTRGSAANGRRPTSCGCTSLSKRGAEFDPLHARHRPKLSQYELGNRSWRFEYGGDEAEKLRASEGEYTTEDLILMLVMSDDSQRKAGNFRHAEEALRHRAERMARQMSDAFERWLADAGFNSAQLGGHLPEDFCGGPSTPNKRDAEGASPRRPRCQSPWKRSDNVRASAEETDIVCVHWLAVDFVAAD